MASVNEMCFPTDSGAEDATSSHRGTVRVDISQVDLNVKVSDLFQGILSLWHLITYINIC